MTSGQRGRCGRMRPSCSAWTPMTRSWTRCFPGRARRHTVADKGRRGRSDADEALALALAGGQTIREAAAQVGVSERTAHRRLDDPKFRARVVELRSLVVMRAAGLLADG